MSISAPMPRRGSIDGARDADVHHSVPSRPPSLADCLTSVFHRLSTVCAERLSVSFTALHKVLIGDRHVDQLSNAKLATITACYT